MYRKSTFLDTYDNLILPSNGPKLWPQVDLPPILPPYVRRAPGRPKKLRKKGNDEKVKNSQAGAGGSNSAPKETKALSSVEGVKSLVIMLEHAMVNKLVT